MMASNTLRIFNTLEGNDRDVTLTCNAGRSPKMRHNIFGENFF